MENCFIVEENTCILLPDHENWLHPTPYKEMKNRFFDSLSIFLRNGIPQLWKADLIGQVDKQNMTVP